MRVKQQFHLPLTMVTHYLIRLTHLHTHVQNTKCYLTSTMQMNAHWPLIISGHLTDVSVHNAFAIWSALFPSGTGMKLHGKVIKVQKLGRARRVCIGRIEFLFV